MPAYVGTEHGVGSTAADNAANHDNASIRSQKPDFNADTQISHEDAPIKSSRLAANPQSGYEDAPIKSSRPPIEADVRPMVTEMSVSDLPHSTFAADERAELEPHFIELLGLLKSYVSGDHLWNWL